MSEARTCPACGSEVSRPRARVVLEVEHLYGDDATLAKLAEFLGRDDARLRAKWQEGGRIVTPWDTLSVLSMALERP